jgi:hypothetical protein
MCKVRIASDIPWRDDDDVRFVDVGLVCLVLPY